MTLPLSVEPPALEPVRCANPTCRRWLSDPVSVTEKLGPECRGWRTRGKRRIAAPKRRASSPDQLDIFNINKGDDMTTEPTGRRRATDQEIAVARAWVEQYTADWIDGEDTERSRQEEYEHALELIVFANDGEGRPMSYDATQLTPEALARLFHETYERLAPDFGYRTREASAKPWVDVPAQNKALMVATCTEILELGSTVDREACDDLGAVARTQGWTEER